MGKRCILSSTLVLHHDNKLSLDRNKSIEKRQKVKTGLCVKVMLLDEKIHTHVKERMFHV